MVVNPKNYTHPNSRYRDLYYTMFSQINYKETEIELGRVEVATDLGWIIEDIEIKNFIKVNKVTEFLQFGASPDKVLISCIFQVSKLESSYSRSYKKLQGVLAEIGGLANAFLIFLLILINHFLRVKFSEALMNQLFEIKVLPKANKKRNKKDVPKQEQEQQKGCKPLEKTKDQEKDKLASMPSKDKSEINPNPQDNQSWDFINLKFPTSPSHIKLRFENLDYQNKRSNSIDLSQPPSPLNSTSHLKKLKEVEELPKEEEFPGEDSPSNKYTKYAEVRGSSLFDLHPRRFTNRNPTIRLSQILGFGGGASTRNIETKTKLMSHKEVGAPLEPKALPEEKLGHSSSTFENEANQEQSKERKEDQVGKEEGNNKSFLSPYEGSQVNKIGSIQITQNHEERESIKVNLTLWEYISSFIYRSKSVQEKIELIEEGTKNIEERLDVINILKKLREVDKLKALLLDHDQLVLFNNLPKPEIRAKDFRRLSRLTAYSSRILRKAKFVQDRTTKQQVQFALEQIKYKERKTKIDQKLLEIFYDKDPK